MKRFRKTCAVVAAVLALTQLSACNFTETAQSTASAAKEKAEEAREYVAGLYHQIDMTKFQNGWDSAVDFASSRYAAAISSQYVANVGSTINALKSSINASAGSARTIAQEAGFVAEKWTAGTFNIDAAARSSSESASVVGSNGMGSVDVSTSYGGNASLKYYNTATKSASQQADNILKKYSEYQSKSQNPMSLAEYLDKYNVRSDDLDALYASVYEGQTRIIPADQYDDAVAYLQSKYQKFSDYETGNGSARAKAQSKVYTETLENLKTRLEAPDGTSSRAATYEEMQAMAELAQKGEFDPADFGFTTSQVITPKYLIKQSVNAGLNAAALNAVLTIGPDIFSILREAAKNGEFDEKQLRETGIEGLLAASEGFIEGSVSCAILTACQSGKLGTSLTDASPDMVGTLTVLAIDAIRFGYALSKGEITTEDYSNLMSEEIFAAVVSQASGMMLAQLLPAVPFAYMAGSLAGGMIATAGFELTKDLILEIRDGGGFEAIVPTGTVSTMDVIADKIAALNISEQVTTFRDMAVSTAGNGRITIKALV